MSMYSDWVSLTDNIQKRAPPDNVLHAFPPPVGREVVMSVVRPLADVLQSRGEAASGVESVSVSSLCTREQVEWTMQVVGHGLSLPLSCHQLITACIDVYDDWLTALSTPRHSVPAPVVKDPGSYAIIIFNHFCQLFVPRSRSVDPTAPAAVDPHYTHFNLCRRVLQITHSILVRPCPKLSRDTWEAISRHLLTVADVLLSPPVEASRFSLGSMLSDLLIHVLFEAWLRACVMFFPPPGLWKSLRELCHHWRHHPSLAEQWSKLMSSLTLPLIRHLYSPGYLAHLRNLPEEDVEYAQILQGIQPPALIQCWFRMLHTLGNPVEMSYPSVFAALPAFQKASTEAVDRPVAYLIELPQIFHEVMRGVARLVYLFLGQDSLREEVYPASESSAPSTPVPHRPSPHGLRRKDSRENREGRTTAGPRFKTSSTVWYAPSPKTPTSASASAEGGKPHPQHPAHSLLGSDVKRPRGNTLLHLFGSWLFEAAAWPLHVKGKEIKRNSRSSTIVSSMADLSGSLDPAHATPPEEQALFEAGRAEAFGALCAIFSSQPCGEPFLPVYLARFYQALSFGLHHGESTQGQALTQILLNSSTLFRKGLPGINLLLPHFLAALEHILPHASPQVRCAVDARELRHASIQLLLSMLSLPLHFLHQPLPDLPDLPMREEEGGGWTFYSLRDWMLWLLFSALDHEKDSANMQMLLHGLFVSIQDIVAYENAVAKMAEEAVEGMEEPLSAMGHTPLGPTLSSLSAGSRRDFYSNVDKDYGSASLFRRACKAAHWCLRTWEGSVRVSLAALELLSGLAQLECEYLDHSDVKQTVVWICEYIQYQAEKDHLQHSKDLHTSIVAAFTCLLTWATLHPYLLGDKNALNVIMGAVELGISGSFSKRQDGQMVYKGQKELKPISGRVKDIAECVLTCIMEQVGSFPLPCGAESLSSLLNEEHLLAKLPVGKKKMDPQFRYFLLDSSLIIGLLEGTFSDQDDALPAVTAVLRSPSGRHCWNMQLRMYPCSGQTTDQQSQSMPRPPPASPTPPLESVQRRHWPDEVEEEAQLRVDDSIPSLDVILDEDSRPLHNRMAVLMAQQMAAEAQAHTPTQSHPPNSHSSLDPPKIQENFETARLFLSHLSLLGMETIQHRPQSHQPSVAMLDHTHPSYKAALVSLDRLPTRFCNTVFVLYCREGCSKPEDILSQQASVSGRPPEFAEFLLGLGWLVDPLSHAGFAGKIRPCRSDETGQPVGISAQILPRPFHYYADSMVEMAFVLPALKPSSSDSSASLRSMESSDSGQDAISNVTQSSLVAVEKEPVSQQHSVPVTHSVQQLREGQGREAGGQERFSTLPFRGKQSSSGSRSDLPSSDAPRRKSAVPQDCAVMVVWLERYEDHASFPLEVLSSTLHGGSFTGTSTNRLGLRRALPCIFIHSLPSGLYQIATRAPRQDSLAGPLIEGMVVSRRTLSRLVRLTAINMCYRHRLENEGYCPPHVKRKRRIEEIAAQFTQSSSVSDFYTRLFLEQALPNLAK